MSTNTACSWPSGIHNFVNGKCTRDGVTDPALQAARVDALLRKRIAAAHSWPYPGTGHFYNVPQRETSPLEWVHEVNSGRDMIELRGATDRYARRAQGALWLDDILNGGNAGTIAQLHGVSRDFVVNAVRAAMTRENRAANRRDARVRDAWKRAAGSR